MRKWLQSEIEWCASDKKPTADDINQEIYRERSLNKDFRLAEALTLGNEVDSLQLVKVLLARGNLDGAREVLEHSRSLLKSGEDVDFWEVAFETSRLFTYQGRWQAAVDLTAQIISSSPVGITVMGAHQIQALALTELGHFEPALRAVEKVVCLGRLYPEAFSLFYAEVLRARLLFLTSRSSQAHRLTEDLWKDTLKGSQIDLDRLLTMARLEVFAKEESQSFSDWLRVQWKTADMMGDDLYRALAEAYSRLAETNAAADSNSRFERVRLLKETTTTEALQILRVAGAGRAQSASASGEPAPESWAQPLRLIYFSKTGKLLDLTTKQMTALPEKLRGFLLLFENARENKVAVEEAFQKVSRVAQFVPHLHGNYISNLVYQLNKKIPRALRVADGAVHADRLLVVRA